MPEDNVYSIQHMPAEERPRERLLRFGPETLTTTELIALVLGSGTKTKPVLQLAQEILVHFGGLSRLCEATVEELCQIKGVGAAKAIQLKASFNLGYRASRQATAAKYRIDSPIHAYHYIKDELEKEKRELVVVILQDAKNSVIGHHVVAVGMLSRAVVHPREIFYPAIRHKAASLILVHNHPSGDPTPSAEDYDITAALVEAGDVVGIPVNDHLIIGENAYVSLRQKGFKFTK